MVSLQQVLWLRDSGADSFNRNAPKRRRDGVHGSGSERDSCVQPRPVWHRLRGRVGRVEPVQQKLRWRHSIPDTSHQKGGHGYRQGMPNFTHRNAVMQHPRLPRELRNGMVGMGSLFVSLRPRDTTAHPEHHHGSGKQRNTMPYGSRRDEALHDAGLPSTPSTSGPGTCTTLAQIRDGRR